MFLVDNKKRLRKKARVRKKLSGTATCPRISVFRSLTEIYAQMIDDTAGVTITEASTKSKELAEDLKSAKGKTAKSKLVGKLLAKKAVEKGITTAVFDRSGYEYHGRVQAIAEGVREGGIKM